MNKEETSQRQQLIEPPVSGRDEGPTSEQVKPKCTITVEQLAAKTKVYKVRWGRILYQLYFFTVGLIMIGLSAGAYHDYSGYKRDYDYITYNWRQDYYKDIKIGYSSTHCNDSFSDDSYVEMNTYLWPGSHDGCDCTSQISLLGGQRILQEPTLYETSEEEEEISEEEAVATSDSAAQSKFEYTRKIHTGATCSIEQLRTRCATVNSQNPKPLQLWSDGSFGIPLRFCGKTQANYSYAEAGPQGDACESTQKWCGSGTKLFCVPKNESCPINYVGFLTKAGNNNDVYKDELSEAVRARYDEIEKKIAKKEDVSELGGIVELNALFKFFFFKNYSDYAPLSELRYSQTYNISGVCLNNNLSNIDPFSVDYPLMNEMRTSCETDPRFTLFHEINEEQFYLCNNFIYIQDVLPYYSISQRNVWGVYFRGYIEWKEQCRGSLLDSAIAQGDSLLDIQNAQAAQIGISIVYFIVISLTFSFFSCLSACGVQWSCLDNRRKSQNNLIFYAEVITKFVLQVTQIAIVCWAFDQQQTKLKFLNEAIDKDCSDPQTIAFFTRLRDAMNNDFWQYDLAILIVFIFTFVVDLTVIVMIYKASKVPTPKTEKQVTPEVSHEHKERNPQAEVNSAEAQEQVPLVDKDDNVVVDTPGKAKPGLKEQNQVSPGNEQVNEPQQAS